jgi:HEPN domain-containing protein
MVYNTIVMALSSEEKFEYWLDAAKLDMRTAQAMLKSRIWLYVAFMCQQAIEKLVKGLYLLYLDDNIPRTHNIRAIIKPFEKKLPSQIPKETLELFHELSICYLNNRYPEYKDKVGAQIKGREAKALFQRTHEVFAWLLTLKP